MKVYRVDKHKIDKPSKLIERPNGFEVISNDGALKIALIKAVVLEGGMESGFYHTVMWIMEDGGWTKVNNTQSYHSKEEFIAAIKESEEFTQAIREYEFNSKNNNVL